MNIYDVIVESLLEGQLAHNRNRYKALKREGKKHMSKYDKKTKAHPDTDILDSDGKKVYAYGGKKLKNPNPGKWGDQRRSLDKAFRAQDAAKRLKTESLAYEIYDIICEGLVKAANKAKKNAKIKKLGGREQNRVNQSYNGPLAGVRLAGDYRRDAVKAGKPENVIGTGEKDFHNRLLKNKIGSGRVSRKLP